MRKQLANHDDPPDRDERRDDGWQDLAVANPTFLLERLGSECGDLQFLRELTVNGLDAIAAQPHPAGGHVVWDLDWQRLKASGGKGRKLMDEWMSAATEMLHCDHTRPASPGQIAQDKQMREYAR